MQTEEVHLRVLQIVHKNPQLSQRELARELGVSLGKAHYCLNALIEMGFIKSRSFRRHKNKLAYAYLLTPSGVEEKARIAVIFLRRKIGEYEALKTEIEMLRATSEVSDGCG
jgi:EPS-associated MarR family transcriptional regulator